jgi:hypothetical protein
MGGFETFLWGLFGGIGAELAVLFGVRQQFPSRFPHWIRSLEYYIIVILMVLVGGGLALAYYRSGTTLTAILAIQVGASAPLFFRKAYDMISGSPKPPDPSRID